MNRNTKLAAGAVLVGGYLYLQDAAASAGASSTESGTATATGPFGFVEVSEDGEIGLVDGVVYDDPESGPANDEPGDDPNATFDEANEALVDAGEDPVDPTSYAPDTEVDGTAPEGGVIADPGDSQVYGRAPEQENDDLNDVGEMDDETAASFDRLANYDDPSNL